MPHYRRYGKNQVPLSHAEFIEALEKGHFVRKAHKGLLALIYYTGIRRTEAIRSVKDQFVLNENEIIYDVLTRLKHGKHTPPLVLPLSLYGIDIIKECVENTKPEKRVWPYSDRTVYNIVNRALNTYPHHLRLSRITDFFLRNYNIVQVKTWTGLSLNALEYYVGIADITKMGRELK